MFPAKKRTRQPGVPGGESLRLSSDILMFVGRVFQPVRDSRTKGPHSGALMQQALLFSAKLRFTASFLALAAVAGCQRPTSPPSVAAQPTAAQIEPAKAVSPPAVTATTPLAGPPIAAGPQLPPVTPEESAGQTLVEETWDAYLIQ